VIYWIVLGIFIGAAIVLGALGYVAYRFFHGIRDDVQAHD
jgi:hypothetical protein